MLRISRLHAEADQIRLKVEGRMTREWLPVITEELDGALAAVSHVQLDLEHVAYVDAEMLQMLRSLPRGRVAIVECPALIQDLLEEKPS